MHARSVTWSCLTLYDPMDYSLQGSSDHGILQARILEWVAMPSSRESSRPRDQTSISLHRQLESFTTEPTRKPPPCPHSLPGLCQNHLWKSQKAIDRHLSLWLRFSPITQGSRLLKAFAFTPDFLGFQVTTCSWVSNKGARDHLQGETKGQGKAAGTQGSSQHVLEPHWVCWEISLLSPIQ